MGESNAKDFSVEIIEASKEFTKRERIQLKDVSTMIKIDELSQVDDLFISYSAWAKLRIHNENAKKGNSKDYETFVLVDKDGNMYYTGSESFIRSCTDIIEEMTDGEPDNFEDFSIRVVRKNSSNYAGKQFLLARLV